MNILNEDLLEKETDEVVATRDQTYGGFANIATTCQKFKDIARQCPSWDRLHPAEKEGIDMILHKITRALYAPKVHRDNYVDISGYSKAILKVLDFENK